MARPDDGIDLGLWRGVSPALLVVPLDTHMLRIGRRLGAVDVGGAASLRAARGFTRFLREACPADPARYDFALSRLGILGACPARCAPKSCRGCGLAEICVGGKNS